MAPGIKVLMPEPGYFRTQVFPNIHHVPPRVEAYAQFNASVRAFEAGVVGNEPGDPVEAVRLMIELVKGTGVAEGKTVPLRMPIGSDAFAPIKGKCEETLEIIQQWEGIGKISDFPTTN